MNPTVNLAQFRPAPTHEHDCPICGEMVPSYREPRQCRDDKERICGRCLMAMFDGGRLAKISVMAPSDDAGSAESAA